MNNEIELENVRFNISPCEEGDVTAFVKQIDKSKYAPTGEVKANDKSHYDRYLFLCDGTKLAVVYDRTALIVSITGRIDFAQTLLDLFDTTNKSVKRSTVPSQGTMPQKLRVKQAPLQPRVKQTPPPQRPKTDVPKNVYGNEQARTVVTSQSTRARLFIAPDAIKRRNTYQPAPTVIATSKGAMISTDEIYPPQVIKRNTAIAMEPPPERQGVLYGVPEQTAPVKRPLTSYGETALRKNADAPEKLAQQSQPQFYVPRETRAQSENGADNEKSVGISISAGSSRRSSALPRRATISFGTDDYGKEDSSGFKINTRGQTSSAPEQTEQLQPVKRKRGRPPKAEKLLQQQTVQPAQSAAQAAQPEVKRRRGRPPKIEKAQNNFVVSEHVEKAAYEYKNGYSVKNYPPEALNGAIKRLKEYGKSVNHDCTEFGGTPQEVKSYTVTDSVGQKVFLRYATKRMTLQLQGKRSDLFGEVMSQVSRDSDYSSALENYVEKAGGDSGKKVSDVQNKLKKRLPTAFEFLSEQSRIDFSYGIHDFGQTGLQLSDYSVLLVPAFRGLERFVFDLQRAEGIKVKMIGQAFDKDDMGRYMLKSGYTQRIGSVIYAEVMVALYTEYFSQRNFFAHSDNTDNNVSRSIPERAKALRIFDHLLEVVEYNAKKLKEIGFSMVAPE